MNDAIKFLANERIKSRMPSVLYSRKAYFFGLIYGLDLIPGTTFFIVF
jgi:hypothetical protein